MKKSRFTEEQIIGVLKQHEAGVKAVDLCREHGISGPTCYAWESKYGGPEVQASARFMLLMASSISCVLLNPTVAQCTPAFWKANRMALTRSS